MPRLVLDQLYQLTLPTPFQVGPVNVYLAGDDPITLIDTGPRDDATRAALDDELRALGLARSDVRRIVITHAHADHYGLAAEIVRDGAARSSHAEVWTHAYNRIWLEDYDAERIRRLMFYGQILIESGIPPEERERLAGARRGMGRFGEAVSIDREIGEGDTLIFAGQTWRALHMPGHAGGMLCFFEPESRTLLSSDHLLRDISSNPVAEPPPTPGAPRPRRLVEYLRELRRAADLHPSIAWGGHGEPIHDVNRLVRQRIHFHERRAQRILDVIGDGGMSAFEIAAPLFGKLDPIDSFLALSEVIGHLQWLEDQHRVECRPHGEVVRWRRVA